MSSPSAKFGLTWPSRPRPSTLTSSPSRWSAMSFTDHPGHTVGVCHSSAGSSSSTRSNAARSSGNKSTTSIGSIPQLRTHLVGATRCGRPASDRLGSFGHLSFPAYPRLKPGTKVTKCLRHSERRARSTWRLHPSQSSVLTTCSLWLEARSPIRIRPVAATPVRRLPFFERVVLGGFLVESHTDSGRGRERELRALQHRHLREKIGRVGLRDPVLVLQIGEVRGRGGPVDRGGSRDRAERVVRHHVDVE